MRHCTARPQSHLSTYPQPHPALEWLKISVSARGRDHTARGAATICRVGVLRANEPNYKLCTLYIMETTSSRGCGSTPAPLVPAPMHSPVSREVPLSPELLPRLLNSLRVSLHHSECSGIVITTHQASEIHCHPSSFACLVRCPAMLITQ